MQILPILIDTPANNNSSISKSSSSSPRHYLNSGHNSINVTRKSSFSVTLSDVDAVPSFKASSVINQQLNNSTSKIMSNTDNFLKQEPPSTPRSSSNGNSPRKSLSFSPRNSNSNNNTTIASSPRNNSISLTNNIKKYN